MKSIKYVLILILASLLFAGIAGCSEDDSRPAGALDDEDGGADGDSDTDTDTDSDSDSDGDSGVDEEGTCDPGELWCNGDWIKECKSNGMGWDNIRDCSAEGLVCAAGECVDVSRECADAINERSYIGCEYWGTTLANIEINYNNGVKLPGEPFHYALAVANDGTKDAEVNVTDGPGGRVNNDYVVPAGQMIIITDLPWKPLLSLPGNMTAGNFFTRKIANGAYHIRSSIPVTVYQFNALEYKSGVYFSYTNDASLLLPAHVYRDEYIVISRPTIQIKSGVNTLGRPGFFAVLGPDDGPTTLDIKLSAHTAASDSQSNETFPAKSPGGVLEQVVIKPYEVLQVLGTTAPGCPGQVACSGNQCCNLPPEYDLTGTYLRVSDGPSPAVFGGTSMSFVPFNIWAADHLEQQMFPLETWGTKYLCAHNITQKPAEPTVWRIVSGSDNNDIYITPQSVHDPVTLDRGEYVEFESLSDFEVKGEGRIAVVQFMVGQNYTSNTSPPLNGDPSMSLGVPVEQYRTNYTFLAPESYVKNYLTVIHKKGAFPELDGQPVAGETVDINDEYSRTNLEITGDIHYIESDEAFAITVYGVGSYTSYMYPGGLDLRVIDIDLE